MSSRKKHKKQGQNNSNSSSCNADEIRAEKEALIQAIETSRDAYQFDRSSYQGLDTKVSILLAAITLFFATCLSTLNYAGIVKKFQSAEGQAHLQAPILVLSIGCMICVTSIVLCARVLSASRMSALSPRGIRENLINYDTKHFYDSLLTNYAEVHQTMCSAIDKKFSFYRLAQIFGLSSLGIITIGYIWTQICSL